MRFSLLKTTDDLKQILPGNNIAVTNIGNEGIVEVASTVNIDIVPTSVHITDQTASSSKSTGAFIVDGGVGIGGQLTAKKIVTDEDITTSGKFIGDGSLITNLDPNNLGTGNADITTFLRGDGNWAEVPVNDTLDDVLGRNNTSAKQIKSTNSNTGTTDGSMWFNSSWGGLNFDTAGHKRIAWNDGSGDFIIGSGVYKSAYNKGASDANSGAARIVFNSNAVNGEIIFQVAQVGVSGQTISYTSSVHINDNGLSSNKPIISTLPNGTAPVSVTSTTVCPNLNASLLEGHPASHFQTSVTASTSAPTASLGQVGDVWLTY